MRTFSRGLLRQPQLCFCSDQLEGRPTKRLGQLLGLRAPCTSQQRPMQPQRESHVSPTCQSCTFSLRPCPELRAVRWLARAGCLLGQLALVSILQALPCETQSPCSRARRLPVQRCCHLRRGVSTEALSGYAHLRGTPHGSSARTGNLCRAPAGWCAMAHTGFNSASRALGAACFFCFHESLRQGLVGFFFIF